MYTYIFIEIRWRLLHIVWWGENALKMGGLYVLSVYIIVCDNIVLIVNIYLYYSVDSVYNM